MSVVRFKKSVTQETSEKPVAPKEAASEKTLNMRIDVVPIPIGSVKEYSNEKRDQQTQGIRAIMDLGKDLFQSNRTRMSNNMGKRLYQTADLYGQTLAVEDMIPLLTNNDLTLRLNAIRGGSDSHTSCMELTTGKLADALDEFADDKNEKLVEVSIASQEQIGKIFLGMKVSNGKHFIQKLDYEISAELDNQLHVA